MIDVVFFAGRHLITTGATRSVVDMIARARNQHGTALIGMGVQGTDVSTMVASAIDLAPAFRRYSLPIRALNRLRSLDLLKGSRDIAYANFLFAKLDAVANYLSARELSALLRQGERPSTFIGMNSMSLMPGRLAKKAGMTYVIHSQWVHPAVEVSALRREYASLGQENDPISKARIARQLEEFEVADLIWCASRVARDSLVENGVDASKIFTAPFGVDLDRFQPPPEGRAADGRFKILMVGGLIVRKGVHILLEAVLRSEVADADLVLNGPADAITTGIIRDYKVRLAERGIELTFGAGDPRGNLQTASVFVLASVSESFGLVVLEAMASGLPVLISSAVGASECVVEGKNGFVFPSRDVTTLARHLNRLYADRAQCRDFGEQSRKVAQEYEIASMSEALMDQIQERSAKLRSS